jgi:hypothetical protein
MPKAFTANSKYFVHVGGGSACGAGRWMDTFADGATRTPCFLRACLIYSAAGLARAPVHMSTKCRPLDARREPFSGDHEPKARVSGD